MGGGVHRKFGDEYHHLLTFRKGLLHKVESGFQRSSGGLLGGLALVRQRTELTAQQVKGLLCTGGVGAAQLALPLVQRGLHLQTVGQLCLAQQPGIALLLGLGFVVLDLLAEQFRRAVRDILRQGSQRLFGLPQKGVAGIGHGIRLQRGGKTGVQPGQQQTDKAEPLVKGSLQQPCEHGGLCLPGKNFLHAVVVPVLVVQIQISRKVLGDLRVLDILPDQFLICLQAQCFVGVQQVGKILPAAGSDELGAVHVRVDLVKVLGMQLQIAQDGAVDMGGAGVVLPHRQVGLDIHATHAVKGDDVKIPDGFVVLRRVACRHDDPARRHSLIAKGLALQKLQHGGGQRLGHAVDLVDEQNALRKAGGLHFSVDAGNDLAHGVLGHRHVLIAVVALPDKGQTHGALAGVVGDGVGHQRHPALPGYLLHHLRFANARRAHQQDGALPDGGNGVFAQRILSKVSFYGMLDLFFGTFDIHNIFPSCQELFNSRYRSSSSARASARALAGRAAAPVNSSSSSTTFIAHGGTLASSNRSPKNRKAVS